MREKERERDVRKTFLQHATCPEYACVIGTITSRPCRNCRYIYLYQSTNLLLDQVSDRLKINQEHKNLYFFDILPQTVGSISLWASTPFHL